MCTDQQHKQTFSLRPESKLFPKFILETSLPGSPENFRITLPAKPGLYEIINLNLSNSCPVKLDQLSNPLLGIAKPLVCHDALIFQQVQILSGQFAVHPEEKRTDNSVMRMLKLRSFK